MKRVKDAQFLFCRLVATIALFLLAFSVLAILKTAQQLDKDGASRSRGWKLPSMKVSRHSKVRQQGVKREKSAETDNDRILRKTQVTDRYFGGNSNFATTQLSPLSFSCNEIRNITIVSKLGQGYTKTVERGMYGGIDVAVKTVQPWSRDIIACKKQGEMSEDECFSVSEHKLFKEALLLQQLKHPNVVKLLGFCWENEVHSPETDAHVFIMVTELGKPMDLLEFAQMDWSKRLRVSIDLARLVHYMANSPLGSLLIRDFRYQQFVMVNGTLKITDLDDVSNKERKCTSDLECVVKTASSNRSLPCVLGRCQGFSVQQNLANLCKLFLSPMLLPGAPENLRGFLRIVLRELQTLRIKSDRLVQQLELAMRTFKRTKDFCS